MEAHTPKREAVEKFIASQAGHGKGWHLRVVDEQESPLIRLEATNPQTGNHPKTLEIHTRQITLTHEEVDESTKKLILRWIDSLSTATSRVQA
jgi:hypothetical protein